MLLEYQQGRIKEPLKNPNIKNLKTYNQFTSNKHDFLNKVVGNYKSMHVLVKIEDNMINSFIVPLTIGGKYKKDVILSDNIKLLLTYVSPEKRDLFEDEFGKLIRRKYTTYYKGEVNNIFTDYLNDIFSNENSSSYNVFNI